MAELLPIYFSVIAFFCALGAMASAFFHIYKHLLNYTEPTYQRYIVRIIFMVPRVLSISIPYVKYCISHSVHCKCRSNVDQFWERMSLGINPGVLLRPTSGLPWVSSAYLDGVSFGKLLSYEAWVIYNFLSLCLAWVGGPGAVVLSLSGRVMEPSWCLMTCCFPPMPLDGRFIRSCKQGCLQFVILKPFLVAVTLILYAKGKYMDGNFSPKQSYLYLTIIYTISYTLALYALALFYVACKDLLQPFNPVPKFIIIKSVVFLTYWQGVLVFLAAKSGFIKDAEEAAQFQDFIICVEMLIAAVGHLYAFPYKEYAGANIVGSCDLTSSLAHALKLNDLYHDTVHQFAPTYHDYVLYNHTAGDEGTRKYRSRTFVPTGQEMDAVRKNKFMFGNKMDEVELSSHSSSATSTPKNDSSVPNTAHSDAMKSSLLMDTSESLSLPYDMLLIDMDFSNYPAEVAAANETGIR
ncbi:hypothetical protein SADUNF_Sadunf13G0000300 [Salix dunnii]|uniref:Uncharacterized protein n=1 Tax=Salix dunnii TaxID=1413687 RepID=A0A835JJJ0_9ROSI|nr:hypothetical protein SADUNF_Sadunf13G0000300 [Salix dunnii]